MKRARVVVSVATVPWRDTAELATAAWADLATIVITRAVGKPGDRGAVEKYLTRDRALPASNFVIVCDDDHLYPAELLTALLGAVRYGVVVQGSRTGWSLEGEPPRLRLVKARGQILGESNITGGGCALAFMRSDFDRVRARIEFQQSLRDCDDYMVSRAIALCGFQVLALDRRLAPELPCGADPRSLRMQGDGAALMLRCAQNDGRRWWLERTQAMGRKKDAARAAMIEKGEDPTLDDRVKARIVLASAEAMKHGRRAPGAAELAAQEYVRATRADGSPEPGRKGVMSDLLRFGVLAAPMVEELVRAARPKKKAKRQPPPPARRE